MSPAINPSDEKKILSHPALPVAKALAKLGYKPASGIWDAAVRMTRTPDLARDLQLYAEAGQPRINFQASVPKILFRALPYGYTVASLTRDYGLKITGAFLVASDLLLKPDETKSLLDRFAREGVWITDSNGNRGLFVPPAARGAAQDIPADDELGISGEITPADLVRIMDRLETRGFRQLDGKPVKEEKSHIHCTQCGVEVISGKKFCPQCGAKLS